MEGSYQISYAQNAAIHSELAFQMIYCLVPWLTGSTVLQQRLLRHGGCFCCKSSDEASAFPTGSGEVQVGSGLFPALYTCSVQ